VLIHEGDTVDPARTKFYGDMQERMTAASTHLLFFELELNRIDDAQLEAALADPTLGHYRPWIEDVRRYRPYQLEDRVEQLFHEKSMTGYMAWNRQFDATIAKLRFQVSGKTLAIEPTLNLLQDRAGEKRKAAAQALARTFKDNVAQFALIMNTLAKDKEISDRWRGFTDIADERHLSNRVERELVDALVTAVRAAYPNLSHRYYALKAKWFGKKRLPYWDRNAPLPQAVARTIGWAEAKDTVLTAYGAFSPKMATIAERFFAERWIDAPVRPGKAPGAFSHSTTPSAHPFVLLNYQGTPRDVMTLAHELGHGVHQYISRSNGILMAHPSLMLAETASLFGEMLTFHHLLASCKDRQQRNSILVYKVESMLNTVARQTAFYFFERLVHTERRGGDLTAARLGELWMCTQRESLGPAVSLDTNYANFWCSVPHFIHAPFYVYAYPFGECIVNSLYFVYKNGKIDFIEKYLNLLERGGTISTEQALSQFGLNARSHTFWSDGMKIIEQMIDELEGDNLYN
jgi:oligoendopeptidase F